MCLFPLIFSLREDTKLLIFKVSKRNVFNVPRWLDLNMKCMEEAKEHMSPEEKKKHGSILEPLSLNPDMLAKTFQCPHKVLNMDNSVVSTF